MPDMGSLNSDTLKCRLKYSGICDFKIDSDFNLVYVGSILSEIVVLPYGLRGLIDTGFSGINKLRVLKFNKELIRFEFTSLSNCNNLSEIYVYENQLPLVVPLKDLYPSLIIHIRKGVF